MLPGKTTRKSNQPGFFGDNLRTALVLGRASAVCISLIVGSSAHPATAALESWKWHGKEASRAFADGNLPETERLLRRAIDLAEQDGVVDERAINLRNSLAEVLVQEGKYDEAKRVYQFCRARLKALDLEDEPVALRTERARVQLVDSLGTPDERFNVHKEILALAGKICGTNSDPYKFILSDTYGLAVAFDKTDEALRLRAELDDILEHQPTANEYVFQRDVELGSRFIMRSPEKPELLQKGIALLENSERKSSRFRENHVWDYFNLYRYLTIGYALSSKTRELRKVSLFLVDQTQKDSLWPDPRLRSVLGSAYYGLYRSSDRESPAIQIDYLRKAISNFSMSPKDDKTASGYKLWAEASLIKLLHHASPG